jgi:hypothetical protein
MHGDGIELHQGLLARRIERRNRTDRGGARVRAQDRDIPAGQFVGQLRPFGGVGEIDRPHLNGDQVLGGQSRSQVVEHVFSTRGDDQIVAACSQFGGKCLADALGGTGDHGTSVGAGGG